MGIYFIRNELTQNVTIGHSGDVKARLHQLQQGNDCLLELVAEIGGGPSLEEVYRKAWHNHRLGGGEWFSIDVFPDGAGGVSIIGRKPQRKPAAKQSYRHQHCVRLTSKQEGLLRRYLKLKGFKTPSEAFRSIVDGLEDWFRGQANLSSAPTQPQGAQVDSGLSQPIDVERVTDVATSIASDVEEIEYDDETRPTGDFGGMLSVQLPESRHDGYD